MTKRPFWFALPAALIAVACSSASDTSDGVDGPTTVPDALSDSAAGPVVVDGSDSEVWSVQHQWAEVSDEAGVAWDASSGLSWEAKFGKWLSSLKVIPTEDGSGQTIQVSTPYGGKTIQPPHLECGETAMMLRIVFSSWYHLPFYMSGQDSHGHTIYSGHFGQVDAQGHVISGFPHYKAQYKDYEPTWQSGSDWPKDSKLRSLHLGDDDGVSFLEQNAGAGAWFDEVVLNKRVGYFLRLHLVYFGSINLADSANMFNITPESIKPGDVLLERWQKEGIGHTIPLFRVDTVNGKPAPSIATGSMPRRQALWAEPQDGRHYFTSDETGGEGNASDGTPYAKLGGGIHRWRTPVKKGGSWSNIVPDVDQSAFVSAKDTATISGRPKQFDQILAYGTPEERRDAALNMIKTARTKLHSSPASCSARQMREDGFNMLYGALQQLSNLDNSAVDAQYRQLEDYVFAQLDYTKSKTCCWDTTTTAMADIVLDNAQKEIAAGQANQQCTAPTVFMAQKGQGDGYQLWQKHAQDMGRAGDWRAWSEDEPCAQKTVDQDTTAWTEGGDYCSVFGPKPAADAGTDDGGASSDTDAGSP